MTQPNMPPALSDEQIAGFLKTIAGGFRDQIRSPILSTPADEGLAFEDITFPSEDGVPLEGWFIPKPGSDKLVIANHPRWFNRSGLPAHLEPWKALGAATGNDFQVNFVPDYRVLHEAGYNVLAYDLRNHGHSGSGNGGLISSGRFESRDVIGSLNYVRRQPALSQMAIGLFSRCLGCNATIFAMARSPQAFEGVRGLVGVQPLSVREIMIRTLGRLGIPLERLGELDTNIRLVTSFGLDDLTPLEAAKGVSVPTYVYQVRDDLMADSAGVEAIFNNMPAPDKTLVWIEGTTRRWDGYTHFQRQPDEVLAWLARRMA